MKRFLTGLGIASAAAVVLARFRRRKPKPEPPAPDPAEELKQKLADTRSEDAPPAEPPAEEPEPLDERRRSVHDRGRAAIDDMLGGENLPGEESE
jgi:hypothetical protein